MGAISKYWNISPDQIDHEAIQSGQEMVSAATARPIHCLSLRCKSITKTPAEPPMLAIGRPSRCGRLALPVGEHQTIAARAHFHGLSVQDLPGQQLLGQWILNLLLNDTLQGPGAVGRIVPF